MQTDVRSTQTKSNRLHRRLFGAFLAAVFVPLSITTFLMVGYYLLVFRQTAVNQLEIVASNQQNQLESWQRSLFADLQSALFGDETTAELSALFNNEPNLGPNDQYTVLQKRFTSLIKQNHNFDNLSLVNLDGQILLSTNLAQLSGLVNNQPFFQNGQTGAYLQPPEFDTNSKQLLIYAAQPVKDEVGKTLGVLVGRANNEQLFAILHNPVGRDETGGTFLVDSNFIQLTPNQTRPGGERLESPALVQAISSQADGASIYTGQYGKSVVGVYRWLPVLQSSLIVEQDFMGFLKDNLIQISVGIIVILGISLLALWAANRFSRSIAIPIAATVSAIQQAATGDLNTKLAISTRRDEIGELTQGFTEMCLQLQSQMEQLEAEAANDQLALKKHNKTLQIFADLSRAVTTSRDPDELSANLVELIHKKYDYPFTGLYLADEDKKWAELSAASGPIGETALAYGHRLAISEDSLIGWVISNSRERVASENLEGPAQSTSPEGQNLPAEAALPLRSRGAVIGALAIQSATPDNFDNNSLAMLQVLADQAAVAIDNARLLAENQLALANATLAYGEISHSGWLNLVRDPSGIAYQGTTIGVEQVSPSLEEYVAKAIDKRRPTAAEDPDEEGLYPLAVPIRTGDFVLGTLNTYKPEDTGPWSAEEIQLLENIADQLGLALESSRLFEESQRRTEYEKVTGQVSASIRERMEIEAVLRTAAQEVRKALGLPEVTVRLTASTGNRVD